MAKAPEYMLAKIGPPETKIEKYQFHLRACEIYSHYLSGATEDEISEFFKMDIEEVKRDLMHVRSITPVRDIIRHNNDRTRILVQREQSESFRRLLRETLELTAQQYLTSGLSPAASLREWRESVGLTQKPEPLVQFNTQQNITVGGQSGGQFSSAEDVVRSILKAQREEKQPVIDIEPEQEKEQEQVPGEDE